MKLETDRLNSQSFLAIVVFLQLTMYAALLLNIGVARQVIGFLYLTFVPGFFMVKLLKLGKSSTLEVVLFSVGLSVAFLMFTGFVINEFYVFSGFSHPLSFVPLFTILSTIIFVLGILAYLRNSRIEIFKTEPLSFSQKAYVGLLVVLPILSVLGTQLGTAFSNHAILLFMLLLLSFLFIVGVAYQKILSSKLLPFALLVFAIALLFQSSLLSHYIMSQGSDLPAEYFVAKFTSTNLYWSTVNPFIDVGLGRLNSMLSITVFLQFIQVY